MTDAVEFFSSGDSESQQLYSILKTCVNLQSSDSLNYSDYNDVSVSDLELYNWRKMISPNSVSGNISSSSYASDDSIGDSILEDNGRISLAYENLRTIPHQIAEKFATQAKFLDLSYNNFQNLSFLSFFDDLDTLILDRNCNLEVHTFPLLLNLKILWINNCNITNLVDWVARIREYCPALEHLSIMGNPGINKSFSFGILPTPIFAGEQNLFSGAVTTDYREYIRQSLPQLVYLDGIQCNETEQSSNNCAVDYVSKTSSSSSHHLHNGKSSNHRTSPTRSFKSLFRLNKRRKKSYPQSSSTN